MDGTEELQGNEYERTEFISAVGEVKESILYDITYMWNLKYDTNEPVYETDSQT